MAVDCLFWATEMNAWQPLLLTERIAAIAPARLATEAKGFISVCRRGGIDAWMAAVKFAVCRLPFALMQPKELVAIVFNVVFR